jgi:hypothetical protein
LVLCSPADALFGRLDFPIRKQGFRSIQKAGELKMDLTREERETILRTSDADDFWVISTASPKYVRKFTKLGYQTDDAALNPDAYQSFTVPLDLISFTALSGNPMGVPFFQPSWQDSTADTGKSRLPKLYLPQPRGRIM